MTVVYTKRTTKEKQLTQMQVLDESSICDCLQVTRTQSSLQ